MSNKQNSDGQLKGAQAWLDRGFSWLALWSSRHPWMVAAAVLALLVVGFLGAAQVRQDNSMESYFNESDPTFAYYKNYIREFNSDEVIYLLYTAKDAEHGPFDLEIMRRIDQLTRAIETEVPFTRKVTSLTNVEFIEAQGDDILIHDLMADFPANQQAMLEKRALALSKPLYVNAIVSPDGEYAAVVVEMTRTSTDPLEQLKHDPDGGTGIDNLYPQVPNRVIREIIERPEYDGIKFWISGDVPMNSEYNEVIGAEIGLLTGITLLLIAPICVIFIRPVLLALLAPLAVVVLTLVLTVGVMGYAGWSINLFFLIVPPLICAVGVAQAVHVLLAWRQRREAGDDGPAAVRAAIVKVGTPCLLAAITTSIGFLGMSVSGLRSIHEMAFYTAFGVMCAFFLSITLLITFAARSKPLPASQNRSKAGTNRTGLMHRCMAGLGEFNLRHPRSILVGFLAIVLVAGAGIAQLQIDFNFLHEFKPHNQWRQNTEKVNDEMGGLLSVVYVFDTGTADGIKNPQVIRQVEGLQEIAEAQPVAQDSISIADIIKELNQAFHGGNPDYYRIPDDQATLAQLLLVYELSGGKEMNDVMNLDRSKTALEVRLKLVGARAVHDFLEKTESYLRSRNIDNVNIEVSGIGRLWVEMADYISETQIKGYSIVFAMIALTMIVAFGSIKIGLLGMLPNLFPIVLALGVMGWIGWDLDYLRLLLATIAIGIAVDDTIHMLTRLRSEFADTGNYAAAVRNALHGVGPAITATTVILTVAFSSYLLSEMAVLSSFGILLAASMIAALIADLFLLPALVLVFKPFGAQTDVTPTHSEVKV